MALLTRLNTVCNLCKISRTISKANLYFRVEALHCFAIKQEPTQFCIAAQNMRQPNREKSIFTLFRRPTVEKLKEEDDIPDEYELIYRNTMHRYLLAGQFFSTVFAGIVTLAVIVQSDLNNAVLNLDWKDKPGTVQNEIYIYMTSFILFCTLIHLLISRMPIRIYHLPQQKTYTFILYGVMPFSKKRVTCAAKELIKIEPSGILPWKDNRYEIKDKCNVILLEHYFRTPADFNILLGYQKGDEDDE